MRQIKIKKKNANIALLLATLALVVNFWAWALLSPLGAKYAQELSLQPLKLSLLLAIPVIVGSLGRIAFGVLTDKFGGKVMFSVVSLLTAVPVIGLALVNGYSQLIIVAFFLGLGGATFAIGIPFVSAWFPKERRGFVLGMYSMGNAGTAVSGLLTPRLSGVIGRNQTFLLVALLLLGISCIFMIFGQNSPAWKKQKGSAFKSFRTVFKQQLTMDLSAVYVITFGALVAFGVYLPVLLKVVYGLSLTDSASRGAGFVLLATIARPVGGWLSDKIGGKKVIQFGLVFIAILAVVVAFQPTLQLHATLAYLSLAFSLGCCNGAVFALVGKLVKPELMGSATGIIGAAGGFGGFVPPLILGLTYQKVQSYAPAFILLSVSAFCVLIFIHIRFKDKRIYKSV